MIKKFIISAVFLSMITTVNLAQTNTKTKATSVKQPEHVVQITTDMGVIKVKLYNETPKHRDNFIKLVKEGYYNGLLFHRIIKGFMIQGGDPDSKTAKPGQMLGNGGPGYTIPAEINPALFHKRGALSAARMGDQVNPKKESSGSQFYIVQGTVTTAQQLDQYEQQNNIKLTAKARSTYTTVGGAPHLDMGYTVFGEVTEGMDVVDKIADVQKDRNDRPIKDVKVTMKVIK